MAGRNSFYTDEEIEALLPAIEGWAAEGLIEEEISGKLGLSVSGFSKYKHKYPSLVKALRRGKVVPDAEVEQALYKRSVGYEYEEVTTNLLQVGEKEPVVTGIKRITKHIPPDPYAALTWLKNRKGDKWRDKQEIDINNSSEPTSIEELKRQAKELGLTLE